MEADHEDEELISISSTVNSFKIPEGLHYDQENINSNDFVIMSRYSTPSHSWTADWCETNKVYIWLKDCKLSSYKKMLEVSNMFIDEIEGKVEETGVFPIKDIW